MKKRLTKQAPQITQLVWRAFVGGVDWEITLRRVDGGPSSAAGMARVWRLLQAGLLKAFSFGVKEWASVSRGTKRAFKIDWSARRITERPRRP